MAYKIALILAFAAQLAAAILALRLNFRYRIHSAWFFVSAALSVSAILRLTTLSETWSAPPTSEGDWVQWASAFASLMSSVLMLAGMSFMEPFFELNKRAKDALESEHNRLAMKITETEEELRLAQKIQRQLLPSQVPIFADIEVYGQSDPAEWTSGDYFDYLTLSDGSTAMIVADVSGHGLGPALLMSSTRASFRGLAATTSDVGELLTGGNRAVSDAVSDRDFVTAMVVNYDSPNGALHYAGAGHVAYLLRKDGSQERLESDAPPLGIIADLKVETNTQAGIKSGDILVVVTDGILETENAHGGMFGESKLLDTVEQYRSAPAKEIVTELIDASRQFAGNQPQQDDITALVVKFA